MHLSEEQLNEYLDHETDDRSSIEQHLASCAECMGRLAALQALFSEIESLAELPADFTVDLSSPAPTASFPRSLTLTAVLQAALAVVALIAAAPRVMQVISPYFSGFPAPSLVDIILGLQVQWSAWLDMLSTFQVPSIPEIPVMELSGLFMIGTVIGASLLWVVGNGLLLKDQIK